jgi:hypothetical protein
MLQNKGQYLEITDSGVTIQSLDFAVSANGEINIESLSQLTLFAFLDMVIMCNGSLIFKSGTNIGMNALELKAKFKLQATIESLVSVLVKAPLVKIGNELAAQSVVRGEALQAWFSNPAWALDSTGLPITITVPFNISLLSSGVKVP